MIQNVIKEQGLTGAALSIQIVPFGFEQSNNLRIQGGLETKSSAYLLIICQGEWHGRMKRSEEFTTFWSDCSCKLVKGVRKILSYAFKMRQDYLSTRYFDQFISRLNLKSYDDIIRSSVEPDPRQPFVKERETFHSKKKYIYKKKILNWFESGEICFTQWQ